MEELRTLNAGLEGRVNERTAQLMRTLMEREVLLQEIHHRVKNNLQVISSLISIQMRKLEQGASRSALGECQTRVQAIALIHEQLYQSRDYAHVPFAQYARSLAANIFHALGVSQSAIRLEVEIGEVHLTVDKAIACGLILNELITNSLKHAFPGDRHGVIRVEMEQLAAGRMRMAVRDDGVGLSAGLDIPRSESLGLQLISTLAQQLGADLAVRDMQPGTSIEATFKV